MQIFAFACLLHYFEVFMTTHKKSLFMIQRKNSFIPAIITKQLCDICLKLVVFPWFQKIRFQNWNSEQKSLPHCICCGESVTAHCISGSALKKNIMVISYQLLKWHGNFELWIIETLSKSSDTQSSLKASLIKLILDIRHATHCENLNLNLIRNLMYSLLLFFSFSFSISKIFIDIFIFC